jgi:hypothetical protein
MRKFPRNPLQHYRETHCGDDFLKSRSPTPAGPNEKPFPRSLPGSSLRDCLSAPKCDNSSEGGNAKHGHNICSHDGHGRNKHSHGSVGHNGHDYGSRAFK